MPFSFTEISTKMWHMGLIPCKLVSGLQATSIFVSTISITAIALDRYKVIVYPTHQETASGTRGVLLLLGSVWIGALVLSFPLFWFRTVKHVDLPRDNGYGQINSLHFCYEDWPFEHGRGIYSVISMIFQYVLPITIVSIVYAKISDKLKKRLIRRQRLTQLECQQKRQLNLIRRTHTMLVSVSLVFGLSWLPLNLLNVIVDFSSIFESQAHYSDQLFRIVFAVCHLIGCSSACSNPILYGFLNENFRKELLHVYRYHGRRSWRCLLRLYALACNQLARFCCCCMPARAKQAAISGLVRAASEAANGLAQAEEQDDEDVTSDSSSASNSSSSADSTGSSLSCSSWRSGCRQGPGVGWPDGARPKARSKSEQQQQQQTRLARPGSDQLQASPAPRRSLADWQPNQSGRAVSLALGQVRRMSLALADRLHQSDGSSSFQAAAAAAAGGQQRRPGTGPGAGAPLGKTMRLCLCLRADGSLDTLAEASQPACEPGRPAERARRRRRRPPSDCECACHLDGARPTAADEDEAAARRRARKRRRRRRKRARADAAARPGERRSRRVCLRLFSSPHLSSLSDSSLSGSSREGSQGAPQPVERQRQRRHCDKCRHSARNRRNRSKLRKSQLRKGAQTAAGRLDKGEPRQVAVEQLSPRRRPNKCDQAADESSGNNNNNNNNGGGGGKRAACLAPARPALGTVYLRVELDDDDEQEQRKRRERATSADTLASWPRWAEEPSTSLLLLAGDEPPNKADAAAAAVSQREMPATPSPVGRQLGAAGGRPDADCALAASGRLANSSSRESISRCSSVAAPAPAQNGRRQPADGPSNDSLDACSATTCSLSAGPSSGLLTSSGSLANQSASSICSRNSSSCSSGSPAVGLSLSVCSSSDSSASSGSSPSSSSSPAPNLVDAHEKSPAANHSAGWSSQPASLGRAQAALGNDQRRAYSASTCRSAGPAAQLERARQLARRAKQQTATSGRRADNRSQAAQSAPFASGAQTTAITGAAAAAANANANANGNATKTKPGHELIERAIKR